MRELGKVFHERRMPSLSSISLHWSFSASKSAMLGISRGLWIGVERWCGGTEGAHTWNWRGGERERVGSCEAKEEGGLVLELL